MVYNDSTMEARFTHKINHGNNVWSFSFAPAESLIWIAGQSVRLEIAGPYGPLEHRFSIASPPSSGEVTITTRLSGSDYKDSLASLQPGAIADLHGLEGGFVWQKSDLPHIFVAAGVGITPFYAIIAERIAQGKDVPALLLCSSRDEPMIYKRELEVLSRSDTELHLHFFKTRRTAAHILAFPNAHDRLIYISGPSKMVDALGTDLIAAGITPDHILRDQFTGRLNEDG